MLLYRFAGVSEQVLGIDLALNGHWVSTYSGTVADCRNVGTLKLACNSVVVMPGWLYVSCDWTCKIIDIQKCRFAVLSQCIAIVVVVGMPALQHVVCSRYVGCRIIGGWIGFMLLQRRGRYIKCRKVGAQSLRICRMSECRLQLVVLCSSCVTIMKNVTGFSTQIHRHSGKVWVGYATWAGVFQWNLTPNTANLEISGPSSVNVLKCRLHTFATQIIIKECSMRQASAVNKASRN